jgi:Tol biopolymer transport system component
LAGVTMGVTAQAAIPQAERNTLIALYNGTGGSGWIQQSGWLGPTGSECTWAGVGCDGSGVHVTSLALFNNNLSGTLPSLAALANLQTIDLGFNDLTGSIPALAGFANLIFFGADNNRLTGSIPPLTGLASLQIFFVNDNRLTGSIPPLTGLTNLQAFTVRDNNLTGTIPDVPNFNMTPGLSSLCPNSLLPTANVFWDLATGVTPWYRDCAPLVPELGLGLIAPSNGQQGSSVNVIIYGSGFDPTTYFTFGSGITVGGLLVGSAASATATLSISASAAAGSRTVTATRGSDGSTVQLANAFTVVAATASLGVLSVTPVTAMAGANVAVTILGTGFDSSTTFGFGSGIGVSALSVTNATQATATLAVSASAAPGARTVTAMRSSDGASASLANAFSVIVDDPDPPPSGSVVLLARTDTPGPVGVGDMLRYSLSLDNGSGADLVGVTVRAGGPASQISATDVQCNATITDGGIDWRIGSLADGASATCTFGARVEALPAGCTSRCQITVMVTASYAGGQITTNAVIGTLAPPKRVSTTVTGDPTTRDSVQPALSADGSVIAFSSDEKDLVSGNTNSQGADIYLRDGDGLRLVSRTAEGQLAGTNRDVALALNGRAFAFIHDPGSNEVTADAGEKAGGYAILCTSQPNSNLPLCAVVGVDGAAPNGDMESPSLSADGKLVAFCSSATNLVAGDTNGRKDVFVTEVRTTPQPIRRMSVTADGQQGDGDSCASMLSGDGRYIVFTTRAANLGGSAGNAQVMRKDLISGELTRITQNEGTPGDADAGPPSISADGQRIAFASRARNLVEGVANGRRNVFVYDARGQAGDRRLAKADSTNNLLVMHGMDGQLPNADSDDPKLACGGNALGVSSEASNLVPNDNNQTRDVFAYALDRDRIVRVTHPDGGGSSQNAALDCDATTGAYDSNDTPNGNADVIGQDDPVRSDVNAIVLDGSYSGNWYNPGQSGHGFLLEALPNGSFYATWYVYQDGQPLFLQGQGVPVGNRLDVDMYSVTSTAFPVGPGRPTASDWGRVSFTFTSSNDGMVSWQPVAAGFTAGSTTLRRLSSASRIESDREGVLGACYSGIWYDRNRSGYGFDVEVNEQADGGRIVQAFWYTYQPDGSPLWLIGLGEATPGGVAMDLIQLGGTGAQFPPEFSANAVTRTRWGTATLTFSPNRLDVRYDSVLPGYGSGTLNGLQRLTVLDQRECTP